MKKSIRFYPALWAAKITSAVLRLFRRNATHLPGKVALAICPQLLAQIGKPPLIIEVTGTNGKTTVCNLLDDVLIDCGYTVLNNRFGGNVRGGVFSTFLNAATWGGRIREQVAVIEIDERSSKLICPDVPPQYLVCTNLFRDSFKRNAHSEFIADILNSAIPENTKLILNGDDLISSHLVPGAASRTYFGIRKQEDDWETPENIVRDIVVCPVCGAPLAYDFARYNHIGQAHCTACDYGTPHPDYLVTDIRHGEHPTLTMQTPDGEETYRLLGENITDAYNMAAAITLLRQIGLSAEQIADSLGKRSIVTSRFCEQTVGTLPVTRQLAKGQNPIACSRAFDFIRRSEGTKAVILLIEDFFDAKHSSEDIAWLYDTDFEFLAGDDIRQIIIGGVRTPDFRVRLLLAGVPDERIFCVRDEAATADLVREREIDRLFLLYDVYTIQYADAAMARLEKRLTGGEQA